MFIDIFANMLSKKYQFDVQDIKPDVSLFICLAINKVFQL